MGVNSLISWAIIDPVMRTVITKTRALGLAFYHWGDAWDTWASTSASSFTWDAGLGLWSRYCKDGWDASFKLCILAIALKQRRDFRLSCLSAAVMLRCGFNAPRLGHCSDFKTRVSTLASWCCTSGEISLASGVWTLLFDDLSLVFFRQPTMF